LVDVAAGVAGTPVVVEVVAEVTILGTISPTMGLLGVVLVNLLVNGRKVAAPGSIRSIA
jgi:hypothetical protein